MPITKNALQRYKTLDECFNDPFGKYSIEVLQEIIAHVLYDNCGVDNGVIIRQLREDIRIMRANGAPICVNKVAKENEDKCIRATIAENTPNDEVAFT